MELEQASGQVEKSLRERFPESNIVADGVKITIDLAEADKEMPDIVDAVVKAGGRFHYAAVIGPNLEDTYLKLVKGRASPTS